MTNFANPADSAPKPPALVLASSSRYRCELLERLHIPFAIDPPEIDETPRPGEAPEQTALRLSVEKARFVAQRHPGALVIGSDQVATVDGLQIGKPGNHARALQQLQLLRGRTVLFHTALCLVDSRNTLAHKPPSADNIQSTLATIRVRFRELADAELEAYLRIEQPYDCAGSAKCEGLGIALLEQIDSDDPTALIGLPLIRLVGMLRHVNYPFFRS
jgi:septum formation protein